MNSKDSIYKPDLLIKFSQSKSTQFNTFLHTVSNTTQSCVYMEEKEHVQHKILIEQKFPIQITQRQKDYKFKMSFTRTLQ